MPTAVPALPEELYGEIVAHLWDDIQSLRSCSLATRKMRLTGQKLLFRSITLRAERNLLREEYAPGAPDSSGTSADLWKLLTRSPHLARYIRSIHIIDLKAQYARFERGDVLVNDVVESVEGDPSASRSGIRRWLPTDLSLPLCAPMLCNLNTLDISYDACWHHLSGRVLNSLIHLMGQPSLVNVELGDHIPGFILNFALSPKIKNLMLLHLGRRCAIHDLVELPNERSTDPVYLDFLYIDRPFVFVDLLFAPTSRFSLSSLRSLCVRSSAVREHAKIWQLLQSCLDTLEDFEFNPTHEVASPALIPFEDSELIDLGKIVSLKTFTASLTDYDETNYAPWFNRIISSASGNRHLEEICVNLIYVGDRMNQTWWHGAFDALLQGEFKSLKRLKIFLEVPVDSPTSVASVYGSDLYDHEGLQQLRSQRGVAVEIYDEESD